MTTRRARVLLLAVLAIAAVVPTVADAEEPEMAHDTRMGWVGAGTFTGAYLLGALFWSKSEGFCGADACGSPGLVFIPVAGPILAQAQVSASIQADSAAGPAYANFIFLWPIAVMLSAVQAGGLTAAIVGFGAKTKKVYVPNEVSARVDANPSGVGVSGTW